MKRAKWAPSGSHLDRTGGSNPDLSTKESRLHKNSAAPYSEIRETCPFFAIFARRPGLERTHCSAARGALSWFFSGTCAVRFQGGLRRIPCDQKPGTISCSFSCCCRWHCARSKRTFSTSGSSRQSRKTPCPTIPMAPRRTTFISDHLSIQLTASNFAGIRALQSPGSSPAAAAVPMFRLR